jgi:hypothetical protein
VSQGFKMKIALLLMSLVAIDCASSLPSSDGLPSVKTDVNYCTTAEQHLQALCLKDQVANSACCDAVKSTKKGKRFGAFCSETMSEGIDLKPRCLSTISSCSQINSCTGSN